MAAVESTESSYARAVRLCIDAEARRVRQRRRGSGAVRRGARWAFQSARYTARFGRLLAGAANRSFRIARSLSDIPRFCEGRPLVSLDFFDTLVYRTVEPPDYIKRIGANYASLRLVRHGFPVSPELLLFLRDEAEAELRRRSALAGKDPECGLFDIIHNSIESVLGPGLAAEEAPHLVRYEIEAECDHLRLAPGAEELLEWTQVHCAGTIVASDTYLENSHFDQIYSHLGIGGYIDRTYLSSEYSAGKYSGRLIREILEREEVQPSSLVHAGDSYGRDVRGAIESGAEAIWLLDAGRLGERRRTRRQTRRVLEGRAPGPSAPSGAEGKPPGDGVERELYTIGRDVLGPAFCLFVLHSIHECHRWGVSDVYFPAREGYLFRRIYAELIENIRCLRRLPALGDHYLYVSRLATSLPSIRRVGDRELSLSRLRGHSGSVENYLATFGLDRSEFSEFLNESNLGRDSITELVGDHRFVERVSSRALSARTRLRTYLQSESFFVRPETKALIDVGWHGTIQSNITHAFHDDCDFPTLVGIYFGRCYDHAHDSPASDRSVSLPGYFYDEKRPVHAEGAVRYCVQIFELAAGAPHGSTLSYEEKDDGVQPVLAPSPTALTREQEWLQAGIMNHAASFARLYDRYEPDLEPLRAGAVGELSRFLSKPTLAEVRALSGLDHSIDWGSRETLPLISQDIRWGALLTPKRAINALRSSFWTEGSLRMSGIPGSVWLLAFLRRAGVIDALYARGWRRNTETNRTEGSRPGTGEHA